MMSHLFVFTFVFLMVAAMEATFPVKARSFTDRSGVECATGKTIPKPKEYVISSASVETITVIKIHINTAANNGSRYSERRNRQSINYFLHFEFPL